MDTLRYNYMEKRLLKFTKTCPFTIHDTKKTSIKRILKCSHRSMSMQLQVKLYGSQADF